MSNDRLPSITWRRPWRDWRRRRSAPSCWSSVERIPKILSRSPRSAMMCPAPIRSQLARPVRAPAPEIPRPSADCRPPQRPAEGRAHPRGFIGESDHSRNGQEECLPRRRTGRNRTGHSDFPERAPPGPGVRAEPDGHEPGGRDPAPRIAGQDTRDRIQQRVARAARESSRL
jgi:hypothetical protein